MSFYHPLDGKDKTKHNFFGGNHNEYPIQSEYNLGDFGTIPQSQDVFFIRGAWSIDKKYRVEGVSWWRDEELTIQRADEAYNAYCLAKPKVMLTHEAPFSLLSHLDLDPNFARIMGHNTTDGMIKTVTNTLLQKCLDYHKPDIFIFGHYHRDFNKIINNTRFICLTADRNLFKKQKYLDINI